MMTLVVGNCHSMPYFTALIVVMVVLSGCWADPECYINSKAPNMALGKTTFASNTKRASDKTVDGGRAEYDSTCMDTFSVENPWLVVDLHESLPVSTIVFTAFTSESATILYHIQVGNTFDATTFNPMTSGYEPCLSRPVSMVEFEVMYVQCDRTLVGRYILIFIKDVSTLRVCEVEVYTEQEFQPEKWTCIMPELQGPMGLMNLGRGRGPNSAQINTGCCFDAQSDRALDGNDDSDFYGHSCAYTAETGQAWWLVDLGRTSVITGVAITNRDVFGPRLSNFKIYVGKLVDAASSFEPSDYEVCAYMCNAQRNGRKYYECDRPIGGNHVAIALEGTAYLTLCEVEIYSDINDVTLPSWTPNRGNVSDQRALYDNDDSTCLPAGPMYIQVPWDPTSKTGVYSRTGYYHCRADFYVNITYTTSIDLRVTISETVVDQTHSSTWTYRGTSCKVLGKTDHAGFTRVRYACFCDIKCWVFIYVKHVRDIDSRLCTINVYD